MNWYYMDGDKEAGPVDSKTLKSLFLQKKIDLTTKVRRESEETWHPFESLTKKNIRRKKCTQCDNIFSDSHLVPFKEMLICESCKFIYVQQLKEGIHYHAFTEYAGFWIRFGAKLIDGIILAHINILFFIPLSIAIVSTGSDLILAVQGILRLLLQIISFSIPIIYSTYLVGKYEATLGKMACGIKIIVPGDEKIKYMKALGRNFAEWLSLITLGIGYILAAFDSEKRALHDRICNTRVVKL